MRRGWLTPRQKCFQFMLETREVRVLSVVWCGSKLFHNAGLRHWNFGHRNCCASVERSMCWWRLNVADCDQCPSQVGCCQLGMSVSDPLATGAPDVQSCSRLVDEQEASAINGVMWSHRRVPVIRRAAAFWIDWIFRKSWEEICFPHLLSVGRCIWKVPMSHFKLLLYVDELRKPGVICTNWRRFDDWYYRPN